MLNLSLLLYNPIALLIHKDLTQFTLYISATQLGLLADHWSPARVITTLGVNLQSKLGNSITKLTLIAWKAS